MMPHPDGRPYVAETLQAQQKRIAELEADARQMREALTEIRDVATSTDNGGAWAAGIALLCLGTLKTKS